MIKLEGTRLGKYEIRSEIGAGAMGVVYHAHDPVLNRSVAVKVLYPNLTRDTQFVERFLREARAAASLDHPNIVTVYDAGEDHGWYYFVMSYLEGSTLSSVLRDGGRLDLDDTLAILRQLADALDYAHEHGMVHRDVKPANVMVDSRGRAILTDFGLVRAAQESRLTATGTVMGTPHYMSPEQASGKAVGPASDLYSLAVMAYEMLCGEVPFDADSTPAILHMHVYEKPPPISQKCTDLPPSVDKVLSKALAKEPAERYGSASGLTASLGQVLRFETKYGIVSQRSELPAETQKRSVPPVSRPGYLRRWLPSVGARGFVILLGVTGALLLGAIVARNSFILGHNGVQAPNAVQLTTSMPSATASQIIVFSLTPKPVSRTESAAPTAASEEMMPLTSTPIPPTNTSAPTAKPPEVGDIRVRTADGMVMLYVPAGNFPMGSVESGPSPDDKDEKPQHTVYLDAFWIDKTEVTNGQYQRCVAEGACRAPAICDWGESNYGDASKTEHPVVCVSRSEARAYCAWAGGELPTEAQWEKAARGTDGRIYTWGNEFDGSKFNSCDRTCELPWRDINENDGFAQTAPVGSYPAGASPVGALDMAGNAWEWVVDWYQAEYYATSPYRNPTGPASGTKGVLRGASWYMNPTFARAADRIAVLPDGHGGDWGFRCVVPATSSP